MEVTLFAYQIVPGTDELLCFAQSLEECRAAAFEQRRDMRTGDADEHDEIGAMTIYECVMSIGDVPTLVDILNDPTDIVCRLLVSKKPAALVVD